MKSGFLLDANLIRDMLSVTLLKALLSMEYEFYIISDVLLDLKSLLLWKCFAGLKISTN